MAALADPHQGLISFQEGMRRGILQLIPVPRQVDLYAHFDQPSPGENRLTYVRLSKDRKTVRTFMSCVMNGMIDGIPCMAVGYATPKAFRNQGLAQQLLADVIQEQAKLARKSGFASVYIEAVIDVNNAASLRVAEAVLKVPRESMTDAESTLPAYRYTAQYSTATGEQI
ncbi:hypothetical protein ACT2FY_39140 [Paraburkholderia fungorum]|uniref:hypothetical protein n=1 Tax=Paraburkholderia fungorum TaxID=134537 RepID=UPI00402B954D